MPGTILLTNDDGIYAEGLKTLATALREVSDVIVAAPDHERSACGHSITMHRPLRADPARHLFPGLEAWSITGTPADCVKLAVEALMEQPPQMVISGINWGANLGTDVLYSGTVSAALEAAILGLPAVAVSLTNFDEPDFVPAAKVLVDLLPFLLETVPAERIFNINIPPLPEGGYKGIRFSRLGSRRYSNPLNPRKDPRGRTYYWLAGELEQGSEPGTDVHTVEAGYISITPISYDLTDTELMRQAKNWSEKLRQEGIF